MARSPWTPITSTPAIALLALVGEPHPSPELYLCWARDSSLRLRFVEECGANRPAVRVLVAAAARLGREYLLVCLNAMSLGQPSIVRNVGEIPSFVAHNAVLRRNICTFKQRSCPAIFVM